MATDTKMDKPKSKSSKKRSSSEKRKSSIDWGSQHSSSGQTPDFRWDLGRSSHHSSEFAEDVASVKSGKGIVKEARNPAEVQVSLKSAIQRKPKSRQEKEKLAISFSEKVPTPFYYPMDGDDDFKEEHPMKRLMGSGGDEFAKIWSAVLEKRFHSAARIIQKWAKKWMISFIIMNDRREELYDELDAIEDRKLWEIEGIMNFRDELMNEAKMDVELEMQENDEEEEDEVVQKSPKRIAIDTVKELHQEIREAKRERTKLKKEKEGLKRMKKTLQYDLRQKTPCLKRIECKVHSINKETEAINANLKIYKEGMSKWEDGITVADRFLQKEKSMASLYRTCLWDVYLELEDEVQESVIIVINDILRSNDIISKEFEKLTTRRKKPALARLVSVRVPRKSKRTSNLKKMNSVPMLKH